MKLTLTTLAGQRAASRDWKSGAQAVRWRMRAEVGWLALAALGAALTTGALALTLDLAPANAEQIALYLGVSGVVSMALGRLALWLAGRARVGLWFRLALPAILSALVIAFNILVAEWLMLVMGGGEQALLGMLFLAYGIALALMLAFASAREMTHTITQVETGARRIAEGAYSYRLAEVRGAGEELARLARWFNQMAASIERSFTERTASEAARRQLVAAVSHDLRTPLASVRVMIEAIDDGVVTDEATVRRYHRAIRAETRRLGALLNDLFELSRLEAGELTLRRERLALDDLLSDALEAARSRAERRGVTLAGQVAAPLPLVAVDARQLRRALDNLLENALRHTGPGGAVLLYAVRERRTNGLSSVRVVVADTGVGISAADLPHIFERTYRGEPSRARNAPARDARDARDTSPGVERQNHEECDDEDAMPGAGLGLTITRGIIEAHGGSVAALSPLPASLRALLPPSYAGEGYPGSALTFTIPVLSA